MTYLSMALALGLALTVAVVPIGLDAGPAVVAKTKSKTVTKSFATSDRLAIPPPADGKSGPYPLELAVGDLKQGKILDVNLTLRGLSHEFPEDIDILLAATRTGRGNSSSSTTACN